ncbi:MAG: hypothetical protein IPH37_12345 [Burkholderiales bacterium]|nr:hypothetical protein [Burkholderiales bacterium]
MKKSAAAAATGGKSTAGRRAWKWGVRYTVYKSIYLELTQKFAYGVLRNVPVYQGSADQTIWMSEQVLSTGFRF